MGHALQLSYDAAAAAAAVDLPLRSRKSETTAMHRIDADCHCTRIGCATTKYTFVVTEKSDCS